MNPIETQQQVISDDGSLAKYFSMMLHIDDDDLDPYEYRLLGHYRKQCGLSPTKICTESIETTASRTKMCVSKARKARQSLADKGCIKLSSVKGKTIRVTIQDRMSENVARYSRTSTPTTSDRTPLPHLIGIKEYKKEKEESSRDTIGAFSFSSHQGYTILEIEPYIAPIAVK